MSATLEEQLKRLVPAPPYPTLTASEWIAKATRLGVPPKVLYFRDEWMLSLPIDSELPMPDRAMQAEIFALLSDVDRLPSEGQ